MTPSIISLVFAVLGIIFLLLSARKTNPVQSKVWLRMGIIFLVVAVGMLLLTKH